MLKIEPPLCLRVFFHHSVLFFTSGILKKISIVIIGFVTVIFGASLFVLMGWYDDRLLLYSLSARVFFCIFFIFLGIILFIRPTRLLGGWILTGILTIAIFFNVNSILSNFSQLNFIQNWISIGVIFLFTAWTAWSTSVVLSLKKLIAAEDYTAVIAFLGLVLGVLAFLQSIEPKLDIRWKTSRMLPDKSLQINNRTFATTSVEFTGVTVYLVPGSEKFYSEISHSSISGIGTSSPISLGTILPRSSATLNLSRLVDFSDPPADNYDVNSVYCLLFIAKNSLSGKEQKYLLMTSSNLTFISPFDDLALTGGTALGGPFEYVNHNLKSKEMLRNTCESALYPYNGAIEF